MAKKGFTAEQIVAKLRQIDVLTGQGKMLPQACKEAGISDVSYYRWRKEYGGLKLEQAKKMKELERENARLVRLVVAVDDNGATYFKRLRSSRESLVILESLNPDGTTPAELLSLDGASGLARLTHVLPVIGVLFELPNQK